MNPRRLWIPIMLVVIVVLVVGAFLRTGAPYHSSPQQTVPATNPSTLTLAASPAELGLPVFPGAQADGPVSVVQGDGWRGGQAVLNASAPLAEVEQFYRAAMPTAQVRESGAGAQRFVALALKEGTRLDLVRLQPSGTGTRIYLARHDRAAAPSAR